MNQLNRKYSEPEMGASSVTVRISDRKIELSSLSDEARNKLLNVLIARHKSNRTQLSILMDEQSVPGVRYLEDVDELMMFVSGVLSKGTLDSASKDRLLILLQQSIERQERLISSLIEEGDEYRSVSEKATFEAAETARRTSAERPVNQNPSASRERAVKEVMPDDVLIHDDMDIADDVLIHDDMDADLSGSAMPSSSDVPVLRDVAEDADTPVPNPRNKASERGGRAPLSRPKSGRAGSRPSAAKSAAQPGVQKATGASRIRPGKPSVVAKKTSDAAPSPQSESPKSKPASTTTGKNVAHSEEAQSSVRLPSARGHKTPVASLMAWAGQALAAARVQARGFIPGRRAASKHHAVINELPESEQGDPPHTQLANEPFTAFDDPKALFRPVIEDDEDEEDDEVDNEQLFELSEFYQSPRRPGKAARDATLVVEVVKHRGGEVIDVAHLFKGGRYTADVGGKRMVIAHNKSDKSKVVYFRSDKMQGEVRQYGGAGTRVGKIRDNGTGSKVRRLEIPDDTDIRFTVGADEYLIRTLMTLESPPVQEQPVDRRPLWKSLATSVVFHFVVLALIALAYSFDSKQKAPVEPEFVKIDVKDLQPKKELVKPKPKPPAPKPEPKPKPKPKPVEKAKVKPKPRPVTTPKPVKQPEPAPKPKAGGGDKGNIAKRDVKKTGLLAALGTKKGKKKGPKEALVQVSSLDAATTSDNSTAKLSVAGLTGKVKDARMTLPTGEVVNTKGTTDILRSGGISGDGQVGALETGGTGQRQVAAKVSPALTRQVAVKKGGMSREQVKRVIDAHMDEIVFCYEMALTNNPGLAGKAVFEWSIKGNGKVGAVSIKDSSVRSDELHGCIKSSIRGWQFPKPQGGEEVIVSYPFIFDMVGF